jgi:hypothetical protein
MQNGYFNDIIDELDKEELVAIVGDPKQLEELDRIMAEAKAEQSAIKRYNTLAQYNNGEVDFEQIATLENLKKAETDYMVSEAQKQGDMRWAEIKKAMLKNIDTYIEFYVTNEPFDKRAKLDALLTMKADPYTTKSREAIEDSLLDILNENPRQFDKTPEENAAEAENARQMALAEQGLNTPVNPLPGGDTGLNPNALPGQMTPPTI